MSWRREPRTWIAIGATLVLWASAFAGIKAGLTSYGPGEVALLRFGTASAVLAVYAVATRMRLPARRDIPVVILAGILGITIYHVALNYGEVTISAGAASLIIASGPVFTALFSVALLHERLTTWGWIGIAVSFLGVAVISFTGSGGVKFAPGAVLVLLSAISTALYFIVSKPPLRSYSALEFTTYAIWAGTLPLLVFLPGLVRQFPHASTSSTVAILYLGVFPGAISYVLWSYALARMPASILAPFLYLSPVLAIVIAWVWIHELPTLLTVVGGAIAIAGVVIVNSLGASKTPPGQAEEDLFERLEIADGA